MSLALVLLLSGCATGTPPPAPVAPPPVQRSLAFRLNLLGGVPTADFTRSSSGGGCPQASTTFRLHYFFVVNTASQQVAQIDIQAGTFPSTWTDYIRFAANVFLRNHRIGSQGQGQQFTGERQTSNGLTSGQTILVTIPLPDNEPVVGWGDPSQYFITAVTYVSTSADQFQTLLPIDSMGPRIAAGFVPENMVFNSSVATSNSLVDSGGQGDVQTHPIELDNCGFTGSDYNSVDINSLQVTLTK